MIRRFISLACLDILTAECASRAKKGTGSSAKNTAASYTGLKRKVAIARCDRRQFVRKRGLPLPLRFYQSHNVLQHRKSF